MGKNKKILSGFFKCLGIGFVISAIKTEYNKMGAVEILATLFLTFMYNLIVGIWAALTSIFWHIGTDVYFYIKKNLRDEGYRYQHWLCFVRVSRRSFS